jgi:hypothetical protein
MTDHQIAKPQLFISHATTDGEFAIAVKSEIEKVFANGVSVFCTSSPGAIAGGHDWLSQIESRLSSCQAVIAIITPVSLERPWLWFEIGATWLKGRVGDCRIYPLCAPEISLSELPPPLDRLQARSMGKAIDLKLLFEDLLAQFGFGSLSVFRASNITKRIPKYKDVKIKEADLETRPLYSGKYTGYDDSELAEILDTHLFMPDQEKLEKYTMLYHGREDLIHNGKLLHFRTVDRGLELPPGTTKRLIKEVALRYGLAPRQEGENIIRFGPQAARYENT